MTPIGDPGADLCRSDRAALDHLGLVLMLLAVLASGWRYHGQPTLPAMAAVGTVAGLGSGAVQIAGPAVIVFWLGGRSRRASPCGRT